MHFLLLVLQVVLGLVAPVWRDSLRLAARADGRVEQHLPVRPGLWSRWLSRLEAPPRRGRGALEVRAGAIGPVPGPAGGQRRKP